MDSSSHRILRSNLIELIELHKYCIYTNQENYAKELSREIELRRVRFERGEFYSESSDSGVTPDSNGGE
jgi:hypothetical protein